MEETQLPITLGLVATVAGIALLSNWDSNRQIPGLLRIFIGFAITSIGTLLFAQQGTLPPLVSVFIANLLIIGGRIPIISGIAHFWNQESSKVPLLAAVYFSVFSVGFYYFTFIDESFEWRVRLVTFMNIVFALSAIFLLVRGLRIERKLRPIMALSSSYGAYLLLTLSSFEVIIELVMLVISGEPQLSSEGSTTNFSLMAAIINVIAFTISILLMTMDELKVEHQENAIFDPITTILNQRTFTEVGNRVLGVALRYSKPVSILTLELTNLEATIKRHGVRVGNELMRHFALMANDRRRNEDVLGRSSYKRFTLLLPGVDEAGAKVVVRKIKEAVIGESYNYHGEALKVEFLISAVTRREEDLHLQQMLQEGEIELYNFKQQGANSE